MDALLSDTQGRVNHVSKAEMAFDNDGKILGLKVDTIAAPRRLSQQLRAPAFPAIHIRRRSPGCIRLRLSICRVRCVYTNTLPIDAYRGSGRP